MLNYHLTGGRQEIFDLTNYASHVYRSGERLSRLLSFLRDGKIEKVRERANRKFSVTTKMLSTLRRLAVAKECWNFRISAARM